MYQQPSIFNGFAQAPATASSHGTGYNNYNPHLMANPNPHFMPNPNPYFMPNPNPHLMANPNHHFMANPNHHLMTNPNHHLMTNPNRHLMTYSNPRLMTNPNSRLMLQPNSRLMSNPNPRLMTNEYPRLMPNPNVGAMVSINPYLPPPPSYFSPHMISSVAVRSEPKFLAKWCVRVNNVKFDDDGTSLIAELSGTLLANDGRTVFSENYYAGRIKSIISHNIVKTHTGVYHLVGPIFQGYPSNLYRACLESNGIPKTWKYILTQFSGKPNPADTQNNQIPASSAGNDEVEKLGKGVQELIKSFRVLRHFAMIAERKALEFQKASQPISFLRHQFHEKCLKSLKIVNAQIILGLKAILKH